MTMYLHYNGFFRLMTMYLYYNGFFMLVGLAVLTPTLQQNPVFYQSNTHRCNCDPTTDCRANGTCKSGFCAVPYTGVTCQHASIGLSSQTSPVTGADASKLLDGNDKTCASNWNGTAIYKLGQPLHFIWIYIFTTQKKLITPKLVLSKDGVDLKAEFYILTLNEKAFLIKLCARVMYDTLKVSALPQDTCTLDVSIGRNLAMSSSPWIGSDSNSKTGDQKTALRGIDGSDTVPFYLGPTPDDPYQLQYWGTRLKHDAIVNWLSIVTPVKCWSSIVNLYSPRSNQLDSVGIPPPTNQHHNSINVPVTVKEVVREVQVTFYQSRFEASCKNNDRVPINEIYIYGEFLCPDGMYGPLCEKRWPEGCGAAVCDADWGCTEECNPHRIRGRCPMTCRFRYGTSCEYMCSDECGGVKDCHPITGACNDGCRQGYYPPNCTVTCKPGFYGHNCAQICINCALSLATETYGCDPITGACSFGCSFGFTGEDCHVVFNFYSLLSELPLLECAGVIVFMLILCYKTPIPEEEESVKEPAQMEAGDIELQLIRDAWEEPPTDVVDTENVEPEQLPEEPKQVHFIWGLFSSPEPDPIKEVHQLPEESTPYSTIAGAQLSSAESRPSHQLPKQSIPKSVMGAQLSSYERLSIQNVDSLPKTSERESVIKAQLSSSKRQSIKKVDPLPKKSDRESVIRAHMSSSERQSINKVESLPKESIPEGGIGAQLSDSGSKPIKNVDLLPEKSKPESAVTDQSLSSSESESD